MSTPEHIFQNAVRALNGRNLPEAERLFRQFLQAQPNHFGALNLITVVLTATGRYRDAEPYISQAVRIDVTSDASFYNYGVVLNGVGKPEEALRQFERALSLNPRHIKALNNRAVTLNALGRLEPALAAFDQALALDPNYFDALYNKGNVLSESGRIDEALAAYDKALALQPGFAEGHANRGRTLQQLGRLDEALAACDRAVALKPNHPEAHFNRGSILAALGRPDDAIASYDAAIAARPAYADAHNNRGVALAALKRPQEALASYEAAIAAKSAYAEAFCNRGNVLVELRRPAEAAASYGRALALKPDFAEAHNNRGIAFKELRRLEEAITSYDAAIAARPDYAEAFNNRGNALRDAKRPDEATASYDAAIALNPGLDFLPGEAFHTRMHACDWRRYDDGRASLAAQIASNARALSPFIALSSFDSCEIQSAASKIWVDAKYAQFAPSPFPPPDAKAHKIRVGYYSADFRMHPMAFLMQNVFRLHDRRRFETFAFSFDNPADDPLNAELRGAFDHFLDVSNFADSDVVALSRERSIDIAIDLAGFTAGRRTNVFALRAAPVQVNFLGFPGTMAAPFIDYIVADATVIDAGMRRFFSEKIITLPDTYYPTSYGADLFRTERTFSRAELGLPENAVVFCCFNNNYKITPAVFDVWMRILRRVEGSVLWLFEDNSTAAARLRKEASARGVDSQRLIFAGRMKVADHLARVAAADLFLDTLPYTAHTTATDALWAGVPIVTKIGESFAARVAASVLKAAGASELVTQTWQGYEALAVELATRPEALAAIKQKLATNRSSVPLFDTARYTGNLEAAYAAAQSRRITGLRPDDIVVAG